MFNEIVANIFGWVIAMLMNVGGAGAENLEIDASPDSTLGNVIERMWDYFAVIGIGLTLVYFLLELNQKYALEGRDITLKTFGIPFLKFMFAIAILARSGDMIGWVFTWGNSAYDYAAGIVDTDAYMDDLTNGLNNIDANIKNSVTGLISTDTDDEEQAAAAESIGNALVTGLNGLKIGPSITLLLMSVLMLLVNIVLSIVWTYKAIAYKLEVLYRVGLTPIAMADIYSGHNSGAIRWIKGCVGLVLYGMSFVILPKLANVLTIQQLTDTITGMLTNIADLTFDFNDIITYVVRLGACIAAPFAALGCLSAIRQLIKEATG